ncbi:MAG: formate dehydrogenase accessory sulfurtransferase FdhD [Deltaproteobacteria bacterium]|nr:MAG: formate dehydrogenase accessory sulfurtransferase FdhD [Deltaproteobacteria bacterium]
MHGPGKNTEPYQVIRCEGGVCRSSSHKLIGEEPLLIRIDGNPYSVVMRTPGEELFHAAGFCLGEGIADSSDDFMLIGYCKDLDPNVIDIRLKPERREKIHELLDRRGFVSQTSCGICGKEMIKDLYQILTPAEDGFRVEINRIFDCLNKLSKNQNYYQTTRGSHPARRIQGTSWPRSQGSWRVRLAEAGGVIGTLAAGYLYEVCASKPLCHAKRIMSYENFLLAPRHCSQKLLHLVAGGFRRLSQRFHCFPQGWDLCRWSLRRY